jgi:5-methylcytosine-specific restriction endonuclease McrA
MPNFDLIDFGNNEPKRKPVKVSVIKKLLVRSKGKCEKCGLSLDPVTPHIHHKDRNPKNNKMTNLKVLCPNCHSNAHSNPIKKKPKDDIGNLMFGKPFKRNPLL